MAAVSFRTTTVMVMAVLLALIVFYVRGPRRALNDSGDFATVYAASRCWMADTNPYLEPNIERQYSMAHGDPRHTPNAQMTGSVYAPSVFPLVSAVAWLNWEEAKRLWLIISVAAFAVSLACLSRRAFIPNPAAGAALIAAFLLFSPVQSGLAKGQPSVICISLLVSALYLRRSKREELLAGLFLGLSCCIKPNIALPYLLFCCWRRQWRVAGVSVATILIVSAVALRNLLSVFPGWWIAWLENLKTGSASGGGMDPTMATPYSYLLVNFQTVIGFFTTNHRLCDAVTFVLLGGLAATVVIIAKLPRDHWQILALLSTLVLLGSYHRYYDVQLLMLATNAAFQLYSKPLRRQVWAAIVPGVLLWFPLQALASSAIRDPSFHAAAPFSKLLEFLAFKNQPLCLLALAALFAWAIFRHSAAAASESAS